MPVCVWRGAGEDAQKGVRRSIDDGVRVMEQGGDLLQRYDDLFIAPGGDAEDQQVDLFQKRVAQGFVIEAGILAAVLDEQPA